MSALHISSSVAGRTAFLLRLCFVAGLLGSGPIAARAQLVADGTTNTINAHATNLLGELIIGTNGSFTRLVITNAAAVTNSADAYIGRNYTAASNQVEVTD